MNLSRLLEGNDRGIGLAGQLTAARGRAADTATKIERLTDALLADDADEAPAAFRRRARELEQQLSAQQAEIDAIEHELASLAAEPSPAVAQAWAELAVGVEALDYDARVKARQLVADTFDRIIVYHRGMAPQATRSWKGTIDLVMVGRHGTTRLLHIDRQSGEWRAGEELDLRNISAHEVPLPPGIT